MGLDVPHPESGGGDERRQIVHRDCHVGQSSHDVVDVDAFAQQELDVFDLTPLGRDNCRLGAAIGGRRVGVGTSAGGSYLGSQGEDTEFGVAATPPCLGRGKLKQDEKEEGEGHDPIRGARSRRLKPL